MASSLDDVIFRNQDAEVKPLSRGDLNAVLEQIQHELAEAREISKVDCEIENQRLAEMMDNESSR
jgi:hypothetical protein